MLSRLSAVLNPQRLYASLSLSLSLIKTQDFTKLKYNVLYHLTINSLFTVLPVNHVEVHLSQTHAAPATAAALDAQSPTVLSALLYLSCVSLSLSINL